MNIGPWNSTDAKNVIDNALVVDDESRTSVDEMRDSPECSIAKENDD